MIDDAANALEEIEPEDKIRNEVLYARVDIYLAAKKWHMAAVVARHQADPENPAAWINLAYAVRRTDSIEQAEVILLSPTSATGVRAEVSASGVAAILAKGRHYTSNFRSRARPAATPGLARAVEALHGADQNTKS